MVPATEPKITIHVNTLGGPAVLVDGSERADLPDRVRLCALLTYLSVERETSRESLAALLWPDKPTRQARHSLNQALHALRKELGSEWLDAGRERIRVTKSLTCDLGAFHSAVAEQRFDDAITMFKGPFMAGLSPPSGEFERWCEQHRLRVDRIRRKAFGGLIAQHLAGDRHEAALEVAEGWVQADSLDEDANHALIELLGMSGRRSDALRQYDRFATALDRELGLTPLAAMLDLVSKIRQTDSRIPRSGESSTTSHSDRLSEIQERFHDAFELLRPLSESLSATVYLAREPALQRLVTIKVLREDAAHDPTALKRFQREALALAGLSHPNVVPIFRVGVLSSGLPYLVLPYIRGGTLLERLQRVGPRPPGEVRRLLRDIASGLAAAHKVDVIHRDIRPGNVLLEEDGRALLSDFGLVAILDSGTLSERLTHTGELLGRPGYASPEQLRGDAPSAQTDIYALGVTGVVLLVGSEPRVPGTLPRTLVSAARQRDPDLVELIVPCLSERANHRPDARSLVAALNQLLRQPDQHT